VSSPLQGTFGGEWEKNDRQSFPIRAGIIKNAFGRSEPVNFDQGGVWIKILNHATGQPIAPAKEDTDFLVSFVSGPQQYHK
jgi:hypothetical protein